MAWVYRIHRWTGLLAGWLLLVICVTGTLLVYKHPLKVWANPTLVDVPLAPGAATLSPDEALARFRQAFPQVTPTLLAFPSDAYSIHSYSFRLPPELDASSGRAWLNPVTGSLHTGLPSDFADFVQRLHAGLWMGTPGRWVVGSLGVLMAVSLLTGLVLHWRRLGRDLFRLRLFSAPRKAWGDLHKFSAVWLFGFHLLIALTGAWLGLESLLGVRNPVPPAIHSAQRQAITMPGVAQFVAAAQARLPEWTPTHLNFAAYGQAPSGVRVQGDLPGLALVQRGQTMVVLQGRDAQPWAVVDRRAQGALAHTLAMMRPLHYGYFGGPWMLLAYFLMGAACSALVFSGLAIWCAREGDAVQRHATPSSIDKFTVLLMRRLNVGITLGLLLALLLTAVMAQWTWTPWAAWSGLAARFAGSHNLLGATPLAPELGLFCLTWLVLALGLASLRPQAAWAWGWVLAGALLALLPALSAASSGGWLADWRRGQGEPFWVAITGWTLALACCAGAWRLHRTRPTHDSQPRRDG